MASPPASLAARPASNVLGETYPSDAWTNVTPTILSKIPIRLHLQPNHPLGILRSLIESHFPTFTPLNSLSPVVSTYKNFDELGFPADHPGRSVTDSYYFNQTTMLRTHTSAHEVETFKTGVDKWLLTADVYRRDEIDASHHPVFHQVEGARTFAADSASMLALKAENEALAARLAARNIVIEDETTIGPSNPVQAGHDAEYAHLVAASLKLHLNSLIYTLFSGGSGGANEPLRVRWIEAYFPFTTPSYEVEVFFQGKWLEILGCGVVQQRTLDTAGALLSSYLRVLFLHCTLLGVHNRISWAFGLGLERIAMVLFSIPDIRLFWSTDSRFLGQFSAGRINAFKPYSKYPECYKDVSFWVVKHALFHENDFCDVVRDVAGDLVEDVKLVGAAFRYYYVIWD